MRYEFGGLLEGLIHGIYFGISAYPYDKVGQALFLQ